MDKSKIWAVTNDGTIQCQQLTPEYVEEAIDMMEEAFFLHENVCKAVGLCQDPKAVSELKELLRVAVKDGVSIIAVDKSNNKVVGAVFNKIQVKNTSGETPYFEVFARSCKQPRAQAVLKFMVEVDELCNLFDHCQVDCLLELMFLGTLPAYRGRGIAKKLCEASLEIGRKLLDGVNVKIPIDGQKLSLQPAPKIASAIFTSFITQRIGRLLDFTIAATRSFDLFEFEGKTYTSVIGTQTPTTTLEYKRLK